LHYGSKLTLCVTIIQDLSWWGYGVRPLKGSDYEYKKLPTFSYIGNDNSYQELVKGFPFAFLLP